VNAEELRALVDDPGLRAEVPAVEAAEAFLARIHEAQPRLRAFIAVTEEIALADARRVDSARAIGERLPLDGMPLAVKDNTDVAGVRTTVGSRVFADGVATEDAEAVRRLRSAGAVVLGKTNLHEFAFGATCRNEAYGTVVNPWSPDRIPGGSSGGSGVALAADLCVGALGTDTGGSVRLPAAINGVSGLRPTYGAVSTRGVFPVSRSLDTVGPMARSVEDLAALLGAAAGFDPEDPWAAAGEIPAELGLLDDPDGLRIGLPREFFFEGVEPEIERLVLGAAEVLAGLGAEIADVELPGGEAAAEVCGLLLKVEALAVHWDRYADGGAPLEDGTRRRLALAEGLTAVDQARMTEQMYQWQRELRRAFARVDVLLTPTIPVSPPAAGGAETIAATGAVVPFTHAISLGRIPALSIPCGLTSDGIPVGVQLCAAWWQDAFLLRVGRAYQRETEWHRQRPPAA
jgi:aspartyl-tRNA(Asn)/glutamyl-tRNA(Gln) amidotransferase subunit A